MVSRTRRGTSGTIAATSLGWLSQVPRMSSAPLPTGYGARRRAEPARRRGRKSPCSRRSTCLSRPVPSDRARTPGRRGNGLQHRPRERSRCWWASYLVIYFAVYFGVFFLADDGMRRNLFSGDYLFIQNIRNIRRVKASFQAVAPDPDIDGHDRQGGFRFLLAPSRAVNLACEPEAGIDAQFRILTAIRDVDGFERLVLHVGFERPHVIPVAHFVLDDPLPQGAPRPAAHIALGLDRALAVFRYLSAKSGPPTGIPPNEFIDFLHRGPVQRPHS